MPVADFERAYDAGIRFVDEELGKLFGFLRDAGFLERSWVIVTADHGEMVGASTVFFGHGVLGQDVMHVPLLIRPPGGCPGGKRIPDAVQLVDLYPTLVELARAEGSVGLDGRSLVPLLRNQPRAPEVVLGEGGITRQAMLIAGGWELVELEPAKDSTPEARLTHPRLMRHFPPIAELEAKHARIRKRSLRWLDDAELRRDFLERMPATGLTDELLEEMRTRRVQLAPGIRRPGARGPLLRLYDLGSDPGAEHDVAEQHPEKVAELKQLLRQEQLRRDEARQLEEPRTRPAELEPGEIRALEALGYGGAVGDDVDNDSESGDDDSPEGGGEDKGEDEEE
jgi:arylsulfatase A-like enzyme